MWMSGMSEVMKCDEKEEKYKREKRKRNECEDVYRLGLNDHYFHSTLSIYYFIRHIVAYLPFIYTIGRTQ